MNGFTKHWHLFTGKNITLDQIFEDIPDVKELMDYYKLTPTVMEVFVNTIMQNPNFVSLISLTLFHDIIDISYYKLDSCGDTI